MQRFSFGLRTRLLALVLLAIIPPFAIIGYTAVEQLEREATAAKADVVALLRLAAREQERLIQKTEQLLITLAEIRALGTPRTGAACSRALAKLHKSFHGYTNIGVADTDGNIFCNSRPLPRPTNIADRSYFRDSLKQDGVSVGGYQIGRVTGIPAINFGHPVRDDNSKVVSVVYAALNLDWLGSLLATSKLPAGSVLTVVDSNGAILARYPDSEKWVGKTISDAPVVNAMRTRQSMGTTSLEGLDGRRRLYAFTKLHEGTNSNSVYLSAGVPEDVVFAATREGFRRNTALLLVVAALVLTGAWAGANVFVLRQANALDAAAQRLTKGDLAARTGLPYGNEELGRVARSFDHMATSLQRSHRALKTLSAGNRALVRAGDESGLLAEMCRIVVEVGGYRSAWIGYAEHDENRNVRPVVQHGFAGGLEALASEIGVVTWAETERGRGPVATAIRTGLPQVARNVLTDPNFLPWRDVAIRHGYASAVAFPLQAEGTTVGALAIYAQEPDAFDAGELELLGEAAEDLAFGIATLRTRAAHEQAIATITQITRYDRLTGLPNHAHFEQHLRQTLAAATAPSMALLVVGLSRMREINDALGFDQGDLVLKQVGLRIRDLFSEEVFVARMRGDEFAVLLQVDGAQQAAEAAERLLDALRTPMTISDLTLDVSAVTGISLFPLDGAEAAELMRNADIAMQQAKKSSEEVLFYKSDFRGDSKQRLALAGELRRAIDRNELVLHYQPKVDLRSGRACGAEALVRWVHPERGMVRPDQFISLAERTGLIKPLTEWVLAAALRQSAAWWGDGLTVPVAVNLSTHNLRDTVLVEKIAGLLAAAGASSDWLELEITEGAVMEDPDGALLKLQRLSDMGIQLFIDDFGTGYSSLSYLKKLPVDAVKIDKSFVADMLHDTDSAVIVRSTITLAHDLGMRAVAEGVENRAMRDQLAALGCDVAQGYFMSKPLPAEQFEDWLRKWDRKD